MQTRIVRNFILSTAFFFMTFQASAVNRDLSALSDCDYAKSMMLESSPLLDKAATFLNTDASYKDIALWRLNTFNTALSKIKAKYELPPSTYTSDPNRKISGVIYSEFIGRIDLFVQEIYTHAKIDGDKNGIKTQWNEIRGAVNLFDKTC